MESWVTFSMRPNHAGDKPGHRVNQDHRSQLATRQHVVADADFTGIEALFHTFVDTGVMATDEDDFRERRQLVHQRLVQDLPLG